MFDHLVVVRGTHIYRCLGCGLATWDWTAFDCAEFYDQSYWKSADVDKGYADYFALAEALASTNKMRLAWITRRLGRLIDRARPRNNEEPRASARAALRSSNACKSTRDYLDRRPSLLDVGCGPGFFVQAAANAGFAAAGVEVSEFAVNFARERLGQNVWQGQARSSDLRSGPYDVVTLWDVLEHVADPRDTLAALAEVIPAGGLLALSTGDVSSLVARLSGARWHLFTLPEHLWFFTPGSLRRLLRRVGLEPVACRYEICWYPVRYLIERVAAMCGCRRVVSPRLGALGKLAVPVTLADIITILARKRPR